MRKHFFRMLLVLAIIVIGFLLGIRQTPNSLQPTARVSPSVAPVVISDQPRQLYEVVKVVDGDTVDVKIGDKIERVRLIGINTPETLDPRKPVECFGKEASEKAKSVLAGKQVILESDPSHDEHDKYGRLLRYVFLEDGTNLNLLMIREGYAYEYTYVLPYKYQAEFKQAQKEAEENKAGLWGTICQSQVSI